MKRLECAETWSDNHRTTNSIQLPGLAAWVYSSPAEKSAAGGDVYFASVCPNCTISRIALADVSGHGTCIAEMGAKLRELMQHHLSTLKQTALMRDLNHAAREELADVAYATMVAVGWHSRGLLLLTNAGHPPPIWFRASRREWSWVETRRPIALGRTVGLPLGLFDDVDYDRRTIRPHVGDLVVLYTDGISEATNPAGEELGPEGVMNLAREVDSSSAESFGTAFAAGVHRFRDGVQPADDATLIVIQVLAA